MAHSFSTESNICDNAVCLALTYDYVRGVPAQGPSYASGGQPADPPEVDILTVEWSRKPDGKNVRAFEWHKVEPGPLFDLIANDEYLYIEICDVHDEGLRARA